MRRFFVCFALLCTMILMVACGGNSSSDNNSVANFGKLGGECYPNKTCDEGLLCDTDNNICIEDPENPVDDSDKIDSGSDGEPDNESDSDSDNGDTALDNGDTTPDGGDSAPDSGDPEPDGGDTAPDNGDTTQDGSDSQPDDTDTTPDNDSDIDSGDTEPDNDYPQTPCDPNPCISDANSTGACTINNNSYVCGCNSGYIFDGTLCINNLPECSPTSATPCIDTETNLIWSGKSLEKMHWADAFNYCNDLNEGGFNDWRLPSRDVLSSLVQHCYNSSGCEGDSDGTYSKFGDIVFLWSSTGKSSEAYGIYFLTGATQNKVDETFNANVRCVRNLKCDDALFNPTLKKCVNPCESEPCDSLAAITDATCVAYTYKMYSCNGKDPSSSLTWSWRAPNSMTWDDAVSYCDNLTESGYSDWHLPNIDELRTLLINADNIAEKCNVSEENNCLSGNDCFRCYSCSQTGSGYTSCSDYGTTYSDGRYSKFSDTQWIWTSSTESINYPWLVSFNYGGVFYRSISENHDVRCVSSKTMEVNCPALPENAVYNSVSSITQMWDREKNYWIPSNKATYNEEPSTKECRFKCKENYFWSPSSNKCIKYPCQDNSCNKTLGNICTGQRSCYNASSSMTCPSSENSTYFGQDAQYATLGVCTPQSFTTLLISSQEVVVDNNTGLTWEKSPSTDSYTWDDRDTHCNELNTSNYGGRSNWRVPNPLELLTIVNNSTYNPATNSNFTGMPTNNSTSLWTSNEYKGDTTKAYVFGPSYGDLANAAKTNTYKVLCVSGNALVPSTSDDFTTSSDGEDGEIVTDNRTGLMWTSCGYEMWKDALAICQNLNTQNYAGYTDWRLPNKNELASLLDLGKSSAPYSNFPGDSFVSSSFWSSSTYVKDTTYAWRVSFSSGVVSTKEKSLSSDIYYIDFRCVRNAE